MKKVILLTILLLFAFSSFAMAGNPKDKKIKKGNMIVGGCFNSNFAIGLEIEEQDNGKDDLETNFVRFDLEGMFGYFVTNGFEIGPYAGINYERAVLRDRDAIDDEGEATTVEIINTDTLFDMGLQLGYFFETNTVAVPYIMLGAAYVAGTGSSNNELSDTKIDTAAFSASPKAGVNIFFTNSVALNLGAFFEYTGGIRSYDYDDKSDVIDHDFMELEYGAAIGVNVFF